MNHDSLTIVNLPQEIIALILRIYPHPVYEMVCKLFLKIMRSESYSQPLLNSLRPFPYGRPIFSADEDKISYKKIKGLFNQQKQHLLTLAGGKEALHFKTEELFSPYRFQRLEMYRNYCLFVKAMADGEEFLKTISNFSLEEQLDSIQAWLVKVVQEAQAITHLNLSGLGLTFLPKEIFLFSQLQKLDFSNNQIKEIPSGIGELCSLTSLNFANNPLEKISCEIIKLKALDYLIVNSCHLNLLPKNFPSSALIYHKF